MTLEEFFNEYFKEEYSHPENKNAYNDFLELLRYAQILDSRHSKSLKACNYWIDSGFLTKDKCRVRSGKVGDYKREELLKKEILNKIEGLELYTYKNAIRESRLYPEKFEKALKNSKVWASSLERLSANESYNCFGLFTKNAIKNIVDSANELKNIDNVFLIQWVGPFESVESCKKWEKENSISNFEYNFYYGIGKPCRKQHVFYYIGKSEQKNVSSRIANESDPITRDFRQNDPIELWIGRFSKRNYRSYNEDEKKQNHDFVELAEWTLVHGFLQANPKLEPYLLNDKKKNKPKDFCCVVNQWHNKDGFRRRKRSEKASRIPGMILHYYKDDDVRTEDF